MDIWNTVDREGDRMGAAGEVPAGMTDGRAPAAVGSGRTAAELQAGMTDAAASAWGAAAGMTDGKAPAPAGSTAAGELAESTPAGAQAEKTDQQIIVELEREIALLPVGYISRKMIHGKLRFYRQWTEEGKIKSQYIKEGQLEALEEGIEKRRELQKQLKEIKSRQAAARGAARSRAGLGRAGRVQGPKFCTNVVIGEALEGMTEGLDGAKRRLCYGKLSNYLQGRTGNDSRVCLITGLRRTGKTTMIRQAIRDLTPEQASRAAYIKITAADSMEKLARDLDQLYEIGYRYVFIDEVTLMGDFIDDAALLSDVYAAEGMRVVLTGTDSLAFCLALRQELYDRAVIINTTFIPFREQKQLLGIDDLDHYIRYGGTLRAGEMTPEGFSTANATFRDGASTKEYIESAVCRNIERSLVGSKDLSQFRSLRALQESGDLMEIVDRVMVNMNLNFLLLVLSKNPAFQSLRLAAWNLRNDRAREEQAAGITKTHVSEIKQALVEMDMVVECPAEMPQAGSEPIERVIFTQPGIRCCQIQSILQNLMSTEKFMGMSEINKRDLREKVMAEVRASMLEDIILLETEKAAGGRHEVYKLQINAGVFGMVVYDPAENDCFICELRSGSKMAPEQYHRLADADKYNQIEKRFGRIRQRFLLCDDPQAHAAEGVTFCRAEDYLCGL